MSAPTLALPSPRLLAPHAVRGGAVLVIALAVWFVIVRWSGEARAAAKREPAYAQATVAIASTTSSASSAVTTVSEPSVRPA